MKGDPTRLTAVMESYHDGQMTWPECREEILTFPFKRVEEFYPDEASSGIPGSHYGTWDEVVKGYCEGLIGYDEYLDLLHGMLKIANAKRRAAASMGQG